MREEAGHLDFLRKERRRLAIEDLRKGERSWQRGKRRRVEAISFVFFLWLSRVQKRTQGLFFFILLYLGGNKQKKEGKV